MGLRSCLLIVSVFLVKIGSKVSMRMVMKGQRPQESDKAMKLIREINE